MAAPRVAPGFDGVVGPLVDAYDQNGNLVKVIAPGFVPLAADGQPVTGSAMSQTEFLAALRSTMAAPSSVNSGTSSVTLLAANANRKGATITNTDANILYVLLSGGTASASNFHVALGAGNAQPTYYEIPFGITSAITGIWAADGAGVALVGEAS